MFGADFLGKVQHAGDAASNILTGSAASFVGGDSRDIIYGNGGKISNVEVLDLNNGFANDITLHKADVLDMNPSDLHFLTVPDPSPLLRVNGDGSDNLHLAAADGWTNAGTDSGGFTIYASDAVKIAIDPAIM